ncbi:hypothetical protein BJ138DRAFT_1004220 [Hygrophoropsis aurantiaca]|uniref:Uncharacterized protein n=1 Tax=Hygrophoropsis aurantiaca TaxID=72124 RepID=A0ACB8AGS9_9AGAM|nr:hypothetical protein BJ138DRAFT_1004220 [Hygrophoropsis aurantiaca]
MDSSPSSFFYSELRRALSEQSFGIARFDVSRPSTPHEAIASVTLLEGSVIKISLTARGYQLDGGQVFESIEGLLQSISILYDRKRRDTLFSKLESLR